MAFLEKFLFLEGSFFKEPVVPLSLGTGKRFELLKTFCVEDREDHGAVFFMNNKKRLRRRKIKGWSIFAQKVFGKNRPT